MWTSRTSLTATKYYSQARASSTWGILTLLGLSASLTWTCQGSRVAAESKIGNRRWPVRSRLPVRGSLSVTTSTLSLKSIVVRWKSTSTKVAQVQYWLGAQLITNLHNNKTHGMNSIEIEIQREWVSRLSSTSWIISRARSNWIHCLIISHWYLIEDEWPGQITRLISAMIQWGLSMGKVSHLTLLKINNYF